MQATPRDAPLGPTVCLLVGLFLGSYGSSLSSQQDLAAPTLEEAGAGEIVLALRMLPIPGGASAPDARLDVLYPTPGERTTLSESEGWQLLVFVAPWCEACLASLPSLQAVEVLEGFRVAVVTSEELPDAALEVLAEAGASFRVLRGEDLGERYRADSLPSAYLVSPDGAVAGLLRGARDWGVLAPLLEELVTRDLGLAGASFVDASLQLPGELAAPSARLLSLPEAVKIGEEFVVEVRISWSGELASYVPQAPEVLLSSPEDAAAERVGVAAESSGDEGSGTVDYRLRFHALRPGRVDVDAVLLRYLPRYEGAPLVLRLPGGSLTITEPSSSAIWLVGFAVVALLAAGVWRATRSVEEPASDESSSLFDALRSSLDLARRERLEGDYEEALRALEDVAGALREEDPEVERVAGELALLAEQIRFGGVVPAGDDLDRIHRLLERSCERLRPDPSAAEREALHLQ
ncbi:MAG: TlpA disulfide reductase family protein [Acidobacteriota bacterium]